MLALRDRLLNAPVVSLQTGLQLGVTSGAIIDPRHLNIVAFYCTGPRIGFNPAVLHVSDVREFSSLGFIVNAAENIMQPVELPRLQEVIDYHFQLEGKLVIEENGHKIGKVETYTAETETFYIAKLHVNPGMLRSFITTEVPIDRSQIVSITATEIIVRQAAVRTADAVRPVAIDNPFRKPKTQAEAITNPEQKAA
jgi:uncharacterized protein YrrD